MYRWLDHTAELELELEAATEREVLADALAALGESLEGEEGSVSEGAPGGLENPAVGATARLERRVVSVAASDRPALLAAWLEELLFLAETAGFIPLRIEQLSLTEDALTATVAGRVADPRPLVKAITYHRLEFEPSERGYRAHVVFDV